jgi:hypothetical protein
MVKREISVKENAAWLRVFGTSHEKETVLHEEGCVFFGDLYAVGIFFYGSSASGTAGASVSSVSAGAAEAAHSGSAGTAHHHRCHIYDLPFKFKIIL